MGSCVTGAPPPELVSTAGAAYISTTPDSALLQRNVRALLGGSGEIRKSLMSMLDRFGSPNSSGALIVASVICLLESVLCSHRCVCFYCIFIYPYIWCEYYC